MSIYMPKEWNRWRCDQYFTATIDYRAWLESKNTDPWFNIVHVTRMHHQAPLTNIVFQIHVLFDGNSYINLTACNESFFLTEKQKKKKKLSLQWKFYQRRIWYIQIKNMSILKGSRCDKFLPKLSVMALLARARVNMRESKRHVLKIIYSIPFRLCWIDFLIQNNTRNFEQREGHKTCKKWLTTLWIVSPYVTLPFVLNKWNVHILVIFSL